MPPGPLESTDLDWREEETPYSVTLASPRPLDGAATGWERRAYLRQRQEDLQWIRTARLRFGQGVSLVDLSAGGALLDSPVPLGPNSVLALEIVGAGIDMVVPFRVLRCEVGELTACRLTYRGACEFTRLIELRGLPPSPSAHAVPSETFMGIDVELKDLVKRAGSCGEVGALGTADVLQALNALHAQMLKLHADPLGEQLGALLGLVVPALERGTGLSAVIERMESQLRRAVPYARLRLADAGNHARDSSINSILINVPGAASSCPPVSIDLPRGVTLSARQSWLLRTTSRLIALLQRMEPLNQTEVVVAPGQPVSSPPESEPPLQVPDSSTETTGWQKVVIRYADGQSLKGYTQDFHASRPHFSLRSSPTAPAHESVIVPLVRLKAVFFVRDFAGNPGYVERTDGAQPQAGRRIEVTLVDDEVIVGSTLNYRSDGQGFFVTPADPLANNIRIFIVANSVRQVRFPGPR